jgi:hypothetical protein
MRREDLDKWLLRLRSEIEQTNARYPANVVPGWPIPFFGDVFRARVLTVGVNPSNQEFSAGRLWNAVATADEWQTRLLNYFRIPKVPPWCWFETWSICLEVLGLTYSDGGAAHIDVSPRPTTPMLNVDTDPEEFRRMAESDVKWFYELIAKLPHVQLLLVAGPIPMADGGKQQLADFIGEQARNHNADWKGSKPLPRLVTPGHPEGIPVFVCPFEPKVDGLYAMVRQVYRNRELLRGLTATRARSIPVLANNADWSSTIGNFAINFGMLDLHVQDFLESVIPGDQFASAKELLLHKRVELIKETLAKTNIPSERIATWMNWFQRLDTLRRLRNHITHSILRVGLAADNMTFAHTLSLPKELDGACDGEAKHLTFEQLREALKTLNDLIEEFQSLSGFKETVESVPFAP